MPLQATSGAASYDAFGGGVPAEPNYIESCFSTWLYTGNGTTQTINNGIDLAGKGGMVWGKTRDAVVAHTITDTVRGVDKEIFPNLTDAQQTRATGTGSVFAFNSNGFSTSGVNGFINYSGLLEVAWTFREQPKFFDVVTYTGNGTNQNINHNLGSVPGCIIVKCTSAVNDWRVYHRSLATVDSALRLNSPAAAGSSSTFWNSTAPTSTQFTVGSDGSVNASGATYIAYLFAHNAGGFGLTGTDNVISCGSYTGTGALQTISLGYEPQWLLIKNATTGSTNWSLIDCMRNSRLIPNLSNAEDNTGFAFSYDTGDGTLRGAPTATGFQLGGGDSPGESDYNANGATYIYIAIRRPMKTPTTGASVFTPVAYTGTNVDNRLVNTGIVTDMTFARIRTATSAGGFYNATRMTNNNFLATATTAAITGDANSFMTPTLGAGVSFSAMNGFGVGNDATRQLNQSSTSQLAYAFQRAPGFFDEVCWTRSTTVATLNHNLQVVPELIIKKDRSRSGTFWEVLVNVSPYDYRYVIYLNDTQAISGPSGGIYWNAAPTATTFDVNMGFDGSSNGDSFVAYLFASCPGVSKVFNFTGNGSSQTINCGFTGGARFVMIKRTDSTGDWYVWDTARGIVANNDPHLSLNTTAAEVTSNDTIDTDSTGFVVNQVSATNVNVNGASYIGLAIA